MSHCSPPFASRIPLPQYGGGPASQPFVTSVPLRMHASPGVGHFHPASTWQRALQPSSKKLLGSIFWAKGMPSSQSSPGSKLPSPHRGLRGPRPVPWTVPIVPPQPPVGSVPALPMPPALFPPGFRPELLHASPAKPTARTAAMPVGVLDNIAAPRKEFDISSKSSAQQR